MPTIDREILEELTKNREACQFYVVNLWNDITHYSKALSFYNVRFYKHIPGMETQFLRKPVHCGNAPPYFYSIPAKYSYVPHILLHKGLMKQESRTRKIERYAIYDPRAIHKGESYYNALSVEASGSEYDEDTVVLTLINELKKQGLDNEKIKKTLEKPVLEERPMSKPVEKPVEPMMPMT